MIARLMRDKGLIEYVEAARALKARYPEARFRLLGRLDTENPTGVPEADLAGWIAAGLIEYQPETRDVRPWLAESSVFVLPSFYREGLPRTLLEALATGRALVTTDMPGCREPVLVGENGYLVPPRDAAALAAALERFLRDPGLAARMGRRSRQLADARFDVEQVNRLLMATMALTPGDACPPAPATIAPPRRADRALAAAALLLLSPLLLLIGLVVRLLLGPPILFRQSRAGAGGAPFRLIKFRSMNTSRDAAGALLPDAERTGAFGRFLRRSRLDELPELWNIARGDMAWIGPRPLLPETVRALGEAGAMRGQVRPGLTGLAQISGNTLLSPESKAALDLWYVRNRTWRLDLAILLRTPWMLVRGERLDTLLLDKADAGGCRRGG
jgi:lipopolysaccharide/colanic/teichoic acid biosynthesis glycosyltransferase